MNTPSSSSEDQNDQFKKYCQQINSVRHLQAFENNSSIDPNTTRVMVKGEGLYLWDCDGNRFLDGVSGMWCAAVGYGRDELVNAAAQQMKQLSYSGLYFNSVHPAVADLSNKLFELFPPSFGRILYTNSGSEANESLIRVVRHYWDLFGKSEKKIFISRENSYHGSSVGSASLGGIRVMHGMGDLPIPNIHHICEPYWYAYQGPLSEQEFGIHAAQELEKKILELGADKVAAFVAEPFQGAGGMIFPPMTYWPEIQRICRKYDVLICADEIVGGFGRAGEWFSHQYFGFEPDTMSIAKGLTSGYIPMGALVISKKIADVLYEKGGVFPHGFTYQGHPVAAAVALANLKLLDEGGIVNSVKNDTGPYFQKLLREVFGDHPLVGEIQGVGHVAALQLVHSKAEKRRFDYGGAVSGFCANCARDEGLIVRSSGCGRIILAPALVATRSEIDELIEKLKIAFEWVYPKIEAAKAAGL